MMPLLMTAMAMGSVGAFLGSRLITDPRWRDWMRAFWTHGQARWKVSGSRERWRQLMEGLVRHLRALADTVAARGSTRIKKMHGQRMRVREQEECLGELSELIDVVALGLSAGISFDAALAMYCARYNTLLARLLGEAMQRWRLGLSNRGDALADLARHLEVPAFSTFVETVTESLTFGAPLAQALTEQAESIRQQRRYAVQERIEKAPIKMLVPTGTLVLPAMLLAILGPLIASLATTVQ